MVPNSSPLALSSFEIGWVLFSHSWLAPLDVRFYVSLKVVILYQIQALLHQSGFSIL